MEKISKLLIITLALVFITFPAEARKTGGIVVPCGNRYTLVRGAYSWPVNGYYSVHPPILPPMIQKIVYLPAWNGVFWSYRFIMQPKYVNTPQNYYLRK